MKSLLLVPAMFLALPPADAAELSVVSGGPAKLSASLNRLESAVQVCFATGRATAAVRVKVSVAASGAVTSARPMVKGAVAQCVAGVLAVQTLRKARKAYTAVLAATGAGGSISRLREAIDAIRPGVDQCLRRIAGGKGLRGKLAVRFVITPEGRATGPAITEDTIGKRAARDCLMKPIREARFPTPPNGRSLEYTLPIAVDVAAAGGEVAGPKNGGGSLQPQKDGPYPAAGITAVMRQHGKSFTACYERHARNNKSLAGVVTLRFTIRDSGRLTNVKVKSSTLKHAGVERCMVGVAKKLKFDSQPGRAPTRVFYPFSFRSR